MASDFQRVSGRNYHGRNIRRKCKVTLGQASKFILGGLILIFRDEMFGDVRVAIFQCGCHLHAGLQVSTYSGHDLRHPG